MEIVTALFSEELDAWHRISPEVIESPVRLHIVCPRSEGVACGESSLRLLFIDVHVETGELVFRKPQSGFGLIEVAGKAAYREAENVIIIHRE